LEKLGMNDITPFITEVRQKLPALQIIDNPELLISYAVDEVLPRLLVTPGNAAEVASVIALAHQHGLTTMARGNGTRMHLGSIPCSLDILLDMRKLNRLLEHEAPDLTCQVEAGITLARLQKRLASKGQWLPIDPAHADKTTLGGLLATNASGPKRLRYGTARDLVIGLRVVQADGEIARSGGRVVKNVAGYDLNKLYIGSFGTLGVIVEANFKLQPLPVAERTLLLTFANIQDTMHSVTSLLSSLLTPSTLELLDSGATRALLKNGLSVDLPPNGYTLALNFEGSSASLTRQINEASLIARANGALLSEDLTGNPQYQFWQIIRQRLEQAVTCKAAILVSQMAHFLQKLTGICQHFELESAVIAHAGNGILYIELSPADDSVRIAEAIAELRQQARLARGSLVVERCPVALKRSIDVWGEPGNNFRLMQRLKEQFDPQGTFVKGRFVGGL
jgi:glycolate oxidase FAD binding subunit